MRRAGLALSAAALTLLLTTTALLALQSAAILASMLMPPSTISDGPITRAFGLLILWQCSWCMLAARDPSRPFRAAYAPSGRLVRCLVFAGLIVTCGLGLLLDPAVAQHVRAGVGAHRFRMLMEFAAFGMLPLMAIALIFAGAPLLARFSMAAERPSPSFRREKGVVLRGLGLLTAAILFLFLTLAKVSPLGGATFIVILSLFGSATLLILTLIGALLRAATDLRHAWLDTRRTDGALNSSNAQGSA
ncbi:MAG: hypothetical protein IBJ10_07385 [Phycisphaerales bacterium]|nr:hypothetical protein [Phycisphaerales bacterium]